MMIGILIAAALALFRLCAAAIVAGRRRTGSGGGGRGGESSGDAAGGSESISERGKPQTPRTWLSSVISVFCSSFSIAPCPLLHLCDSKPGLRSSYFLPPCFLHYATARDDLRRRSLEFPRNRDGSSLGLADDERVESLRICLASKKLQEKRSFLLWHFSRKREKARGERGQGRCTVPKVRRPNVWRGVAP